jgi:lipopolysaccharide transport system permease protein
MPSVIRTTWLQRSLVVRLTRREIEARFRGSLLGLFWVVVTPLIMLGVYSFVFGSVFGTRWTRPGTGADAHFGFPMLLFLGLIIFSILSEPLVRAPGLMLENVSYIKKVVFPLELLPIVSVLSALFSFAIAFLVFLCVYLVKYGLPPVTVLLLPLSLIPFILFTLGMVYFLSSIGVFLRDIGQMMPLATTALLFMSPILFPLEAVPEQFRWILYLNPVTHAVEDARALIFWGIIPSLLGWSAFLALSAAFALLGAYWFLRTRNAFADVV